MRTGGDVHLDRPFDGGRLRCGTGFDFQALALDQAVFADGSVADDLVADIDPTQPEGVGGQLEPPGNQLPCTLWITHHSTVERGGASRESRSSVDSAEACGVLSKVNIHNLMDGCVPIGGVGISTR